MYKATLTLAILAVAEMALAQPYCLITAINKFPNPADQQTICTKQADKAQSYLKDLCPPDTLDAATKAFKDACSAANYSTSSNSTSSSVSGKPSSTAYKTGASTAIYTTTYYDTKCSCTKTKAVSTTYKAASTGFATGTAPVVTGTSTASSGSGSAGGAGSFGSGSAATGSPIAPVAPSSTSGTLTGAGSQNVASGAGALFALGALVMVL